MSQLKTIINSSYHLIGKMKKKKKRSIALFSLLVLFCSYQKDFHSDIWVVQIPFTAFATMGHTHWNRRHHFSASEFDSFNPISYVFHSFKILRITSFIKIFPHQNKLEYTKDNIAMYYLNSNSIITMKND